jgi:hypothetical protein
MNIIGMKTLVMDFIARNKPVFVIGFVTLLIFISIIAVSEVRRIRNNNFGPVLIKVEGNIETERVEALAAEETENSNQGGGVIIESFESTDSLLPDKEYLQTDLKFGTVRIEYTYKGFDPVDAKVNLNQKVRWINNTDQTIFIKQNTLFFKEFKTPLLVPANGNAEFRMYHRGTWLYEEQITKTQGSVSIL